MIGICESCGEPYDDWCPCSIVECATVQIRPGMEILLLRYVTEDGAVVFYSAQVPMSSEAIDLMTNAGWEPSPPDVAEDDALENTVLFNTGDEDVRLRLFTVDQWADAVDIPLTNPTVSFTDPNEEP
jgi:hypothetical protein